MRYFIDKDKDGKAVSFFRFDASGDEMVEQRWLKGKWVDDPALAVSKMLATGDGDLVEVSKKDFDKWFPGK